MKSFVHYVSLIGLLVLFGPSITLQAQDRNLPGYIVRVSGDTLQGFLKEQGADESGRQISFKSSVTDNYQVFAPNEVKSFKYDDGYLFRAITYPDPRLRLAGGTAADSREGVGNKTCYGKLLVAGEDDLYMFTEQGAQYFLVRKDSSFLLLYDDDWATAANTVGNFRSELNFLATGCDAINKEVERASFSESDLTTFIKRLDTCLNPNRPVETYHFGIKGYSQFYAYVGGIAYGSRAQFTMEAGWRRVWPQINPNLSLNIGLRFANLVKLVETSSFPFKEYHQANYQITSIPVTMQYDLDIVKGRVQMFALAGLSLSTVNISADTTLPDNSAAKGLVLGVGMQVKITHWLRAKVEWREEYMAQFPTAGLAIRFP